MSSSRLFCPLMFENCLWFPGVGDRSCPSAVGDYVRFSDVGDFSWPPRGEHSSQPPSGKRSWPLDAGDHSWPPVTRDILHLYWLRTLAGPVVRDVAAGVRQQRGKGQRVAPGGVRPVFPERPAESRLPALWTQLERRNRGTVFPTLRSPSFLYPIFFSPFYFNSFHYSPFHPISPVIGGRVVPIRVPLRPVAPSPWPHLSLLRLALLSLVLFSQFILLVAPSLSSHQPAHWLQNAAN